MIPGAFCKTEIQFLEIQDLISILRSHRMENCILLASEKNIKSFGLLDDINLFLQESDALWIKKDWNILTEKVIYDSVHMVKDRKTDQIIAIGGGATIDLAKCISAYHNNPFHSPKELLDDLINKGYLKHDFFPSIIAVPTTAGTGSEITQWATVWMEGGIGKLSLESSQVQPDFAYIVPELTLTLPASVTIATGLDALSQAIEAFWARNSGWLSSDIALRAIDIIMSTLPLLIKDESNLQYRMRMCRGSLLAGIAFSKTRTTACHAISYALTQEFGIEHGIACAITLHSVWIRNRPYIANAQELNDIFLKYGGLQKWLVTIAMEKDFLSLHTYGVKLEDIDYVAEKSIIKGRSDNNPVEFSKKDIKEILMECF